jgi:hypothetical protein
MFVAADLFVVSMTDSTDPYGLVRQWRQALESLDFGRKDLDRSIESVQRLLDLQGRSAGAESGIERFSHVAMVSFVRTTTTQLRRTVPVAELRQTLDEMDLALNVASEIFAHKDRHVR